MELDAAAPSRKKPGLLRAVLIVSDELETLLLEFPASFRHYSCRAKLYLPRSFTATVRIVQPENQKMSKKRLPFMLVLLSGMLLATSFATARDEDGDKPRGEERERDKDERDRPRERGPRDGDRPRGERGPRDGDRPPGERPPRNGDRPDGARRPSHPVGPILDKLDTNHNGVLESEEIDQAIVVLRSLDRNGDGKLDGEEFAVRREGGRPPEGRRPTPEQMKERFKEADKNGDGKLSKEEAPERMREGFSRIDTDGSGFVEEKELEAMLRRFQDGQRGPQGQRDGDRGRGDAPRGQGDRRRPETE